MDPQEDRLFFFFGGVAAAMSSLQVASQQPCHALPLIPRPSGTPLKGGRAGIYGCGIQESAHLNMKTRHCILGCSRVVPSGFGLAHCHHLRLADGGGWCLPRCQCSHSFRLKSIFLLFFLLFLQVFVFLPSSIA